MLLARQAIRKRKKLIRRQYRFLITAFRFIIATALFIDPLNPFSLTPFHFDRCLVYSSTVVFLRIGQCTCGSVRPIPYPSTAICSVIGGFCFYNPEYLILIIISRIQGTHYYFLIRSSDFLLLAFRQSLAAIWILIARFRFRFWISMMSIAKFY